MGETFHGWFVKWRENRLEGRYITNDHIEPIIKYLPETFRIEIIGKSVLGRDVYSVTFGDGPLKILMWSQMHGNESTTTKAVFDLINTIINENDEWLKEILVKVTIKIIPILNPDGANAYTRVNANNVDLNRDAQDLTQPESIMLRNEFNKFKPSICLNLHGQRTIFGAGNQGKAATVSFLAPTQDHVRSITPNRKVAMQLINEMRQSLEQIIPSQIGVYEDSFNLNCVGDTFQHLGVPTILFEAGHFSGDYQREYTRYLIYHSYMVLLQSVVTNSYLNDNSSKYFEIPQNEKCFFDIIVRNVSIFNNGSNEVIDVAIQYEEMLQDSDIQFIPKIAALKKLNEFHGHKELNADSSPISKVFGKAVFEGDIVYNILLNNEDLSLSPEKN
ncbi:M14 family zinc carboxypeptidase [Aegicerativicinus sediminis]|uniref:M14 family zinc carboxypeptidase n=1 Tax=Aegicerativicinus sediminis TaxID=2893202 RepID=UPI001E3E82F8|nr:M14 family zinc carboxypeptidase [Aegicerativicinus sediminis]